MALIQANDGMGTKFYKIFYLLGASHGLKLEKQRCISVNRKFFFLHRVVGGWDSLDQEMMDAPSVNGFKTLLCILRGDNG